MATSDNNIIIHWFRQDLRLDDNPSFSCAAQNGTVIPVFIFDDVNCSYELPGGASKWWLHGSLKSLNKTIGGKLYTFSGDPIKILLDLAERHDAKGVYWNRCYEPWQIERDRIIKIALGKRGIETQSFNGSLLWEPWDVLKKDRTPYKVFTSYSRKCCEGAQPPRVPLPAPKILDIFDQIPGSLIVDELGLVPKVRWTKNWNRVVGSAKKPPKNDLINLSK